MKQLITILAILLTVNSFSQTLAFPCAIGAGAYATGGRGGKVCHVNTLTWNTAVTYDAATDSYSGGFYNMFYELDIPARYIVFDVSGTIVVPTGTNLNYKNRTNKGNITVAGQTSNIVFSTDYFRINDPENIIWRYTSFVQRANTYNSSAFTVGSESTTINGNFNSNHIVQNLIFDHCGFFYGGDETFDLSASTTSGAFGPGNPMTNMTVQYCLMGGSSKGVIIGSYIGDIQNTFARNGFVDASHRFPNPLAYGNSQIDCINNYVESFTSRMVRTTGSGTFNVQNYAINPNPTYYDAHRVQYQSATPPTIWSSGTIINGIKDTPTFPDFDLWKTFAGSDIGQDLPIPANAQALSAPALVGEPFTIYDANQLITLVVPDLGQNKRLDENGSIILDEYALETFYKDLMINPTLDSISNIRYPAVKYPTPNSVTPYLSTLKDGIPDTWRAANMNGENYDDIAPSGLPWIEEFLNLVDTCGGGSIPSNNCSGKNAPTATISSPLTVTYNKADTIDFGITYTSDTTVTTVDYYLNNTLLANTTTPFTLDTLGLAQGAYTVHAILTDACGKTSSTDSVTITITPLEVTACNTLTTPVIDGLEDLIWSTLPSYELGVTENGLIYPDTNDLKASYKITWDATSLYFFVRVKDDILVSDSPPIDFYRDDAVSILIDASDNNSTTYDADDFYIGLKQGSNDIVINNALYTGAGVTKNDVTTTAGYDMEVKIDWSYLGLTPTVGNDIGLDFRVDDDNGGSRENHLLWNDETSTLWANPSKFGVLKLTNTACQNTTSIKIQEQEGLTIYPNPTNGELTVTSSNEITKIEVYNSLGALVLSKDKLSSKTQELSIVNLPKGVYSIKVCETNRTIEKQIIKQ